MKTPKQVLAYLTKLFQTSSTWSKGAYARNIEQTPVHSRNKNARSWCIQGALEMCDCPLAIKDIVEEALRKQAKIPLVTFNDKATWAELRQLLKATRLPI